MKTLLRDSPPGYQASGSRFRRPSSASLAERCSAARVRFAAANHAAPLPPARRSARHSIATGGSIREPDVERFLRLAKDENQVVS